MKTNFVNNIDDVLISTDLVVVKGRSLIDKKKVYMTVKRTTDVTLSSLALIVLMPLILCIGLIIKLDSKGSVFYKQKRIGKNGKKYKYDKRSI